MRKHFVSQILIASLFFILGGVLCATNITISGTVTNPLDKPVKKATVTLRNLKDEVLVEDFTNRKGKFILEEVEPKFYYLVINHEEDGSKRIKINPRKNQNNNLDLVLSLTGSEQPVDCYLFSDEAPTSSDPVLKVRGVKVETSAEHIIINWRDIKQAKLFNLFENNIKIYVGEETRFEKNIDPGVEFCYTLKAFGDYGLEGDVSDPVCASAPTTSPRDIKIDVFKNNLTFSWSEVNGAKSYNIYRDDLDIGNVMSTSFKDNDLEFGKDYY